MIDNDDIARMLRHYEGPPEPRGRSREHRRGRWWRASPVAMGLAIVAALVTVAVVQPFSNSRSRPEKPEAASCGAAIQYGGGSYTGNRVDFDVALGGGLGSGTDTCGGESVDVLRIVGVDPQLAVARAGEEGIVYVAAGRCVGFTGTDFDACLHQPLHFSGAPYAATRLLHSVELGQRLGPGTVGAHGVQVFGVDGIVPSRAVALAPVSGVRHTDIVYLAPGICPLSGLEQLERCLETP